MSKKAYPLELIGEEMEIIDSKNKSNLGLKGKIIDETKMTLRIKDSHGKEKILFKNNLTLRLVKSGLVLRGKEISGRPEERIKK
ncbi:MAG TPA: ribonuclease P protein subunit [Candidatus Nanoarchaeia archaeon]|nr:ribonuclease P protein subunit [Candidatus Nanoarchaeia archaeon]